MTRSPAVTVVIPVFNRTDTIGAAVESVLEQTYSDLELLVVDDGSTDRTLDTLATISDPRLRVLASPRNMGVSAARNRGIREARGDWVAFQDSDDLWLPDKLERQMARIAEAGADCVGGYCGMLIVGTTLNASGAEAYYPPPGIGQREGDILEMLLKVSLISTQTLVARREALDGIGGFDEELPALVDWDCVLRLARLGKFAFVDKPLVKQFFSENSITRSREKRAFAKERIVAKNLDLLSARPAVLAGHYRSISGERRRLGDVAGARESIANALRTQPLDPRLWVISAYLAISSLFAAKRA